MEQSHDLIVTGASVLAAAAVAQVISFRTKIPVILLYLATGVIFGPIGFGFIQSEQLGPALEAGIEIAVAIIVFEGAFSLEWPYLRVVSRVVRNLVTIGSTVTVLIGAIAAHYVAGLDWSLALLFGALVLVTGPTAITPLLQRVRVTGRTRATLSGEGVIIDPIGVVVTLVIFEFVEAPDQTIGESIRWAAERIGLGAALGVIGGMMLIGWLRYFAAEYGQIARISLPAGAVAIFAVTDSVLTESGLSAVVAAGLVAGNLEFPHREEAHQFKGDITTIVIASVYLLLAATLELDDVTQLGWRGPAVVLIMMLIARPLAVYLSSIRSALTLRERSFVAAIGPRGVVAASLATFVGIRLQDAGIAGASSLLGLVFLTIAITIAVQASYADWIATRLGVRPMSVMIVGAGRVGRMLAERLTSVGEEVTVIEMDPEKAETARKLGIPVVVGDATLPAVLEKGGVRNARTVVATTRSDKDNLLACQIARTRYDREHVVSRVTDPDSLPSFEALGIRVMNPAAATAMILSNLVRRPSIFGLLSNATESEEADVTEAVVSNEAVAGRALKEISFPGDSLVLLIRRGGKRLVPHGASTLEVGDVVTIVGTNGSTQKARELMTGRMRVDG